MSSNSPTSEKRRYWEIRLRDLLTPIPVVELLKLSWAIEAFRNDRVAASRRVVTLPGKPSDHQISHKFFIPPWGIDAVLNERLVIEPNSSKSSKILNLKSWPAIAKIFNTYNGLANIESTFDYDSEEITSAMQRLFWPQYNWQMGFVTTSRLARAWYVYGTQEGKAAFFEKHGIEMETFLKMALAIFSGTEQYPAVKEDFLKQLGFARKQVDCMLSVIGGDLRQQSNYAKDIRDVDIPRDFRRSAIKERPVFKFSAIDGRVFYIPSRESLLLRVTDGLYFDTVHDSNARRRSGDFFEDLVKRLIKHYNHGGEVSGECDTCFGKSADIFQRFNSKREVNIFECKARRLPQRVLTSPRPWDEFKKDYDDLSKGVVQIWRTHAEVTAPQGVEAKGLVVLFDPWTLFGNSFTSDLMSKAAKMADALRIPDEFRISVAFVDFFDLEKCLMKYEMTNIREAVRLANTQKYFGYSLSGICSDISNGNENGKRFDYDELAKQAISWWGK